MPVFDLGYRPWTGERTPVATRWAAIAQIGIGKAWKLMIVRRLLLMSWLPALYFGLAIFLYEYWVSHPGAVGMDPRHGFLSQFLSHEQASLLGSDPSAFRSWMWTWLAFHFFRGPQSIALVILMAVIGAPLIAQDVRSKAFILYFSRPISRAGYLLGKAAVLAFYLSLITLAPGIVLYILGVSLSPGLSVIGDTWDLPLRMAAASFVMILPTALMMLALSSLTREQRFAMFGWFLIWVFGFVAYQILSATRVSGEWYVLSPWHLQANAQEFIFGIAPWNTRSAVSLFALAGIVGISLPVLWRRISAPMRI